MKKLIILLFVANSIIVLNSCNNVDQSVKKFKTEVECTLDSIRVTPILLDEKKLILANDLLISMRYDPDTVFRVFKLPNMNYLGGFGTIGKGPNEFMTPIVSSTNMFNAHLSVADMRSLKLIDLISGEQQINSVEYIKSISFPGILSPLNYAYIINDSIIYGLLLSKSEKELIKYNIINKKITNIIDFPDIYPKLPEDFYPTLYLKQIDFAPDRSKFVFTYIQIPILRIYSINGDLIKQITYTDAPEQTRYSVSDGRLVNNSRYFYYQNVQVTNDYIFALYELRQFEEKKLKVLSKKEMHVFDWNGNPILKINLKEWISTYVISPDSRKIFFINPMKENYIYFSSLDSILN
jgi:hypothetical protein